MLKIFIRIIHSSLFIFCAFVFKGGLYYVKKSPILPCKENSSIPFLSNSVIVFNDSGECIIFLPNIPDSTYPDTDSGFDSLFSEEFYKLLSDLKDGVYTLTFYIYIQSYEDNIVIEDLFFYSFNSVNSTLTRVMEGSSGYVPIFVLFYIGGTSIEELYSTCLSIRVAISMETKIIDILRTFPATLGMDHKILVSIKKIRDYSSK